MVRQTGLWDLGAYAEACYLEQEDHVKRSLHQMHRASSYQNPALALFKQQVDTTNTEQQRVDARARLGHAVLDSWFECVRRTDKRWPRSETQIKGTNMVLGSLCWFFFGESMEQEMNNIKKRLNIQELDRWYFAEWARREGKTMMMCLIVAITMYVASHIWFLVYSNGGRASKSFHARVFGIVNYLCDGRRDTFIEINKETVQIRSLHELGPVKAALKSYPSSPNVRPLPKKPRGCDGVCACVCLFVLGEPLPKILRVDDERVFCEFNHKVRYQNALVHRQLLEVRLYEVTLTDRSASTLQLLQRTVQVLAVFKVRWQFTIQLARTFLTSLLHLELNTVTSEPKTMIQGAVAFPAFNTPRVAAAAAA